MSGAVPRSAHSAGGFNFGAGADCTVALTGVLRSVKVAQKPLGDGFFVPALVIELEDVGAGHHQVTAHVTYQPGQEKEVEAKAAELRRGQHLTVTTHLADVRLHLPAASLSHNEP